MPLVLDEIVGLVSALGALPQRIRVTGTATGCTSCTAVSVTLILDAQVLGPKEGPVQPDGSWTVDFDVGSDFDPGDLVCGPLDIKTTIQCTPPTDCAPISPSKDVLACRLLDVACPTIDLSVISVGDCLEQGMNQGLSPVVLQAVLTDVPAPTILQWDYGDGALSTATTFSTNPVETSHPYAPGATYTARLVVIYPEGCGEKEITVDVPPCPEPACPDEVKLQVWALDAAGQETDEVDPAEESCLPAGTYRVRVEDPTGAGVNYTWSVNGTLQAGADGTELDVALAQGDELQVTVVVMLGACAPLSAGTLLRACADCPNAACLEVIDDARDVVVTTCERDPRREEPACLPPGRYVVRVAEPDADDDLMYGWTIDGVLQDGADDRTFGVSIEAGETLTVGVAVARPGCVPIAAAVELVGCQRCEEEVLLEVVGTSGRPVEVDDDGCVPPGRYTVTVLAPSSDEATFTWMRNGELQPETGRSLTVSLAEGESANVAVTAQVPGCPPLPAAQRLRACACPDDGLVLEVDREGAPVPPGGCVAPGNFEVRVVGGGLDDAALEWTRDGAPIGNGTSVGFRFRPLPIGNDCGGAPSTTVTVRAVTDDPDCPDQTASVTLTACRRFVLESCVSCWLLRLLVLLAVGLFAVALALFMCPAIVALPGLPLPAPVVAAWEAVAAAAISAAPWVALAAAAVAVIALGFWIYLCNPTWCDDWLVLLWQLAVGVGVVFIYFGACPACIGLLFIGVPLFLLGAGLFVWWITSCRPTLCKIFFEIGNLGLVQIVIGWLQVILGACVWAYGPLFMAVWQTLLNGVGWIGFVIACLAAPPAD